MKDGIQKVHPKMHGKNKSSLEYRVEKIVGFINENVHEKIKSMEARPPEGVRHKNGQIK